MCLSVFMCMCVCVHAGQQLSGTTATSSSNSSANANANANSGNSGGERSVIGASFSASQTIGPGGIAAVPLPAALARYLVDYSYM